MSDKVSNFPGRKPVDEAVGKIVGSAEPDKAIVTTGGDQGGFQRPPCGTCISWRKTPALGIGQGTCMAVPPAPQAILNERGQPIGQLATRLGRRANDEGCDMHDTGEDDEDGEDDDPDGGSRLASVG